MDFGLQNKTVLVTAASKGLGFATAKLFAAEGAKVMVASRNEAALASAVAEITKATGNQAVACCVANMADAAEIEHLYDEVKRQFGGVDILINNAGGPPQGTFDMVTDADWEYAYHLSLQSVVRLTRLALPHMRQNQWGRIVNFTSSSIKQPLENLILSNTFRAGVAALAKSLSIELAKDKILVNTLGPGRIATDRVSQIDATKAEALGVTVEEVERRSKAQIPLGRYGDPDEFARLAVFLGSPANGYITGQSILVDGGLVKSL